MYKCPTCGMGGPSEAPRNHDRACWTGEVAGLYFLLDSVLKSDGKPSEYLKDKCARFMDSTARKIDPAYDAAMQKS